jgi:hypothetical protein
MTVILQANPSGGAGVITCDSLNTITPNEAYSVFNCPVSNKTRTVVVDKGQTATIRWEMRDREGRPVNLQNCIDAGSFVFGRIVDNVYGCGTVVDVEASVYDAEKGLVDLVLPESVVQYPNIYSLQFGLVTAINTTQFVDKGWLSVERGTFGTDMQEYQGPLTIGEIRMQLRDYAISNSLRGVAEFDDAELIHSIIMPIREWNETPPIIGSFSVKNFPYHYHWLIGACANLMLIGANWYRRNKLRVSHGGVQDDDKNRDAEYESAGMRMRQQWLQFMRTQKQVINNAAAYGSFV